MMQFGLKTSTLLLLLLAASIQATPFLYGVNYGLRKGPDWAPWENRCKTYEEVYNELSKLKQITENVRIYSLLDCNDGAIMLQATQELGMGLWLGLWVGPDSTVFDSERNKLLELIQQFDFFNVLGIHVSSEAIYRGDITSEEAIGLRNIIKADMDDSGDTHLISLPITVTDIEESLSADRRLITLDDSAVTVNMFPFWERGAIDINGAAEYFAKRMEFVERIAGSREIIITETGWADGGENEAANNANAKSQAKWLRDFVCLANRKNWKYFWFNAYDDSWRRVQAQNADSVEGHFGIFYESGNIKPYIRDLVIDCSQGYTDIDPNDDSTPPPAENLSTLPPTAAIPITNTPRPTTASPTNSPTRMPVTSTTTKAPTVPPTNAPTVPPTNAPTVAPTKAPTSPPTQVTNPPTLPPTRPPTVPPTTGVPTLAPTTITPTSEPTSTSPTSEPTAAPSGSPTGGVTQSPTFVPTGLPTMEETFIPTELASLDSTDEPLTDNNASQNALTNQLSAAAGLTPALIAAVSTILCYVLI